MNTPPAQRLIQLGLVLLSLAAGLVALELGLRAWRHSLWHWPNLVLEARKVHFDRETTRFRHDDRLGHVPRDGLRANGNGAGDGPAGSGAPILAVGDSYTYGDEVDDFATWPAQLQALTGRRTLNGGVSGYGFDQIVLRAESLAREVAPSAIVVSFIADDIRRMEMRRMWGAEKPYFAFEGDGLALANVPVPPPPDPTESLGWLRRAFGRSYLVDFTLRRLDLLHHWFGDHARVHPEGTGERLACRLTERLQALQQTSRARVLLVGQYDPWAWQKPAYAEEQRRMVGDLLACGRRRGLLTVDTFDALAGDGAWRGLYAQWHMNEAGNRLVARIVAGVLQVNGH
ncbi:MAG: hypothetical protein KIT25_10170 [Enhydrobacter sp.]|nr:MAG: hypothetical protein KIT25_10170 [Enhydrobacter sp.]